MVQEEMLFIDISYLELWQPFCSAERNHLWNFGRRYHEEQFCELFWICTTVVQEMSFTRFLIWSSGGPHVQRSETVCAILVEGIMWNNSVKLFWICTSGSGDVFYKISYLGLWWPSCSAEQSHLCTFGRWHYGTHSCEIILNLGQRFRR